MVWIWICTGPWLLWRMGNHSGALPTARLRTIWREAKRAQPKNYTQSTCRLGSFSAWFAERAMYMTGHGHGPLLLFFSSSPLEKWPWKQKIFASCWSPHLSVWRAPKLGTPRRWPAANFRKARAGRSKAPAGWIQTSMHCSISTCWMRINIYKYIYIYIDYWEGREGYQLRP